MSITPKRRMMRAACTLALAVSASSGFAFGEQLEIAPYLQNVTKNSVVVRWVTSEPSQGVVNYGLGSRMNMKAAKETQTYKLHEVPLEGLEAGRTYSYHVNAGGKTFTGRFRTAPMANQPFTFLVWGDNRTYPENHKAVMDQAAKNPIDLAISVGDITSSGKDIAEYKRELFDPAREFFRDAPFFVAVGNHEYARDPGLDRYSALLTQPGNERYFAFTYGNARFVLLDSNDKTITGGKQLDWLVEELKSKDYQDAEFRFLFLHHAPYCWDWYGGEKKIEEAIVPLAEKNRVDIFFAGHFHCYERGKKTHDGFDTYYVVTGGGGGEFTEGWAEGAPKGKPREFMTVHDWRYHFVMLTVDGKTVRAVVKDKDGTVMDQFSIEHK